MVTKLQTWSFGYGFPGGQRSTIQRRAPTAGGAPAEALSPLATGKKMRWPWSSQTPTAVIASNSMMPQAQVQLDMTTERSNDSTSFAPSSAESSGQRPPRTPHELLERGLAALEATPKEERGTSLLINDVGELLREQGRLDEARYAPAAAAAPCSYFATPELQQRHCMLTFRPPAIRLPFCRALFTEALEARRAALGDSALATLTSLNNLGLLLREQKELPQARALLSEAVTKRRAAQGDRHPETLTAINNLAACERAMGNLPAAQALYEECLAARREELGAEDPDTLTSINNLAAVYRSQGNTTDAEGLMYEAAATARKVLGPDHPHTKIFERNHKALAHANRTNPIFTQPTEADKPLRSETEFRPLQRTLGSVTNRGSATNRGGATNRGRATARQ